MENSLPRWRLDSQVVPRGVRPPGLLALLSAAALALACEGPPISLSAQQSSQAPHSSQGAHAKGGATAAKRSELLLAAPRQLTFAGARSGEGYFSKDGQQLVFQSEREVENPFYQIYLMDLETGMERRVSTGVGKTTCGWIHPSGGRVLFASTHRDPGAAESQRTEIEARSSGVERRYSWDYDPAYDLFVRELSEQAVDLPPRVLAPARGYDAEGSYSPDGRTIVFASNRHAYEPLNASTFSREEQERLEKDPAYFVDLYAMDARGGSLRRLTTSPGYDGGPFFSPDGQRIVWRRFSEDGARAEIHSMRLDGSDEQVLTRLGVMSWAPFYHPSGDYVIFSSNREGFGNFELELVDASGQSEPVRVTRSEGFDGLPAFSPDGMELVWTSQRGSGKKSQLFRAAWNDSEARRALGLPPNRNAQAAPLLPVPVSTAPEVRDSDLRAHVEALTSDVTAGRRTGTPGERIATGYVARVFRSLGLRPAGSQRGYFQEFGFTAGVSAGEDNSLFLGDPPAAEPAAGSAAAPAGWIVDRDWRPLAFSRVGEIEASEIVFAGYGLVAPASGDFPGLDSYGDVDVRDRWVVVFRYVPGDLSPPEKRHLRRFASLRHKAMIARDRGARGLLVVSGPRSRVREELAALRFDASHAGTSIAAASVTDAVAEAILAPLGRSLSGLQQEADAGKGGVAQRVPEQKLSARIDLKQERRRGRNVLGRIQAGAEPSADVVLIGAHIDHLGRGPSDGSLATEADQEQIHRGADDNASGVASLIEMAERLSTLQARGEIEIERDLVFAAWSGEELGLLGSVAYADSLGDPQNPHAPLSDQIAAVLNMDMVGRLQDSALLYGVGSSPDWPAEIERAAAPLTLAVETQTDAYLPTDATTFYLRGVPILSAFTGVHADYHTPTDTSDKLDYVGLAEITRFLTRVAQSLAAREEPPQYLAVAQPTGAGPSTGLRVRLGTIPDYAHTEVQGVQLSGVASEGPADRAGLRAGDVIVGVGERAIENIYDYTYALEHLEVDEPVEIRILRDGREQQLTIIPGSRE